MAQYKIVTWNADDLTRHHLEVEAFLTAHQVDILLISETHFTQRTYFKIAGFITNDTEYPNGNVRGRTAVLISRYIMHHELAKFMQATTIVIKTGMD